MSRPTIQAESTVAGFWQFTGEVELRIAAINSFRDEDGNLVPAGNVIDRDSCRVVKTVTVNGDDSLSIPAVSELSFNNTSIDNPNSRYIAALVPLKYPKRLVPWPSERYASGFSLQSSLGIAPTWEDVVRTGLARPLSIPNSYWTRNEVIDYVNSQPSATYSNIYSVEDYPSLSAAVSDIGSGDATLIVSVAINGAGVTIPSNIHTVVQGAGEFTGSGILTIVGPFDAPPKQVFGSSLTVKFDGNYALQEVYPEWWGASPSASASTNTTALQAAIRAAFGTNRTNGSGDWVYNRVLKFSGIYSINDELDCYHLIGFRWEGQNKLNSGIKQTATNKRIIDGESMAYGVFNQLRFESSASQGAGVPLIDINYTGAQGSDLKPQNITFYDCAFIGNNISLMGVWLARAGGAAQGDNIRFYNCFASGFTHSAGCIGGNNTTPLTSSGYAYNAIYVQWIGGDIQACPKYGLASYGGSWLVQNLTCENQTVDGNGIPTQTNADFHFESPLNTPQIVNVRSESLRLLEGDADIKNCTLVDWGSRWYEFNSSTGLAGTQAYVGQLFTGSYSGGDGKLYQITRADIVQTAYVDCQAPYSTSEVNDPTGTYPVNSLIGQIVALKATNGYIAYSEPITANTATTITAVLPFEPGEVGLLHTQYSVISELPVFGGLSMTTATSGSGSGAGATITVSGAGWTVDEFAGWRISILSGTGKYQYGVIDSNTSDTITLDSNGWVTDYPLEALYPDFEIVAADNTTHFVVEPDWGTQTTSGTTVEWEEFDYVAVDGYAPGSSYFNGSIDGLKIGQGARINNGSRSIQNLEVTRQDWASGSNTIFNNRQLNVFFHNIAVYRVNPVREGLSWTYPRNGGAVTLGPGTTQRTQGTEWITWQAGQYGGGSNFTTVGIGRGDDQFNTTTDKDILATLGKVGRKTARGTDQAGEALQLQGGLSTGTGTPGAIEFYIGEAGSSGTSVNSASKTMFLDSVGLHLPILLFADVGTPSDGTLIYVSDGTAGSPLTGGGTGCLAIRAGGAWIGLS